MGRLGVARYSRGVTSNGLANAAFGVSWMALMVWGRFRGFDHQGYRRTWAAWSVVVVVAELVAGRWGWALVFAVTAAIWTMPPRERSWWRRQQDPPQGPPSETAGMELLGHVTDDEGERALYLARLPSLGRWESLHADPMWNSVVERPVDGFALFVACDATTLPADLIAAFAAYCVDRSLFWVSTWGPDCERFHDLFDRADLARNEPTEGIVLSTWHADETLAEALVLFWSAFPAEGRAGGRARIALTVGPPQWADLVRRSAADHLAVSDDV
jgi:hypothetical protein